MRSPGSARSFPVCSGMLSLLPQSETNPLALRPLVSRFLSRQFWGGRRTRTLKAPTADSAPTLHLIRPTGDGDSLISVTDVIAAGNVRTLWVYRPKGMMSGAEQLRILAYVLPDLLNHYQQHPTHRHYQVDAHGQVPHTRVRLRRYEL